MAATASAPPTQVQKRVKAEIQFTGDLDEILKRITEIKNIAGVKVILRSYVWKILFTKEGEFTKKKII